MLPRLSELRLKAAPVGVGAEEGGGRRARVDDVPPLNVLMGLPPEVWQHILERIDDKDACDGIVSICQAGGTVFQSLCGQDATYDGLNETLGWYGSYENLDGVRAWCNDPVNSESALAEAMTNNPAKDREAQAYFAFVCTQRKMFLEEKSELYDEKARLGRDYMDEAFYRASIRAMVAPRGAPTNYAQAKWMVRLHPYTFEFLPGSFTTKARATSMDLMVTVAEAELELANRTFVVMGTKEGDTFADMDQVAVPGYTEIAKIAVQNAPNQLRYVRGSIDDRTGIMPFTPCDAYDQIAELAVARDGLNLSVVPGSTLRPGLSTFESYFPDPVPNYAKLAKIAASSERGGSTALGYVPGSIDPMTGRQLRPAIKEYFDIAEVHMREHPWSLKYVPGSVPLASEFHHPRLHDYAKLAKIAIEKVPATFEYVPLDFPEYEALEAFRDRVVVKRERERKAAK